MKLLIASDLHGDSDSARRLAEAYAASGADKLLLLGDLLYHGPRNDLPPAYAPKGVIPLLSSLAKEIICVRGNCDTEVDAAVLPFPILSEYSYIFADGIGIFATHGHRYGEDFPPRSGKRGAVNGAHARPGGEKSFRAADITSTPDRFPCPKAARRKAISCTKTENSAFLLSTARNI
jgi:predicted phosphodiesterase